MTVKIKLIFKYSPMKITTAEILTIGDEILYGQILDTNSKFISDKLDSLGVKVVQKTSIGDIKSTMMRTFKEAEERADIIIITGGLGPTNDDLTKPCLAEYFDCPIEMHSEGLQHLTKMFESRGYELTETNKQQAALPTACKMLTNHLGSAPGMWFDKGTTTFISLPGVPYEMEALIEKEVIPRLEKKYVLPTIYHKVIKTIGKGESYLAEMIKNWEAHLPKNVALAYLPSIGQVKLRLTAVGTDRAALVDLVEKEISAVTPIIAPYIFGFNGDTMESAVGSLLKEHKKTLATAESCTGGYLAHLITSIPGSSEYFQGSVVAYDNQQKENILGVDPHTLQAHGAVSEATVIEMASGIKEKMKTSFGVATSGIAGPDGGSAEKPVGTIWIALAHDAGVETRLLQLGKNRMVNIQATAVKTLDLIRRHLNQTL